MGNDTGSPLAVEKAERAGRAGPFFVVHCSFSFLAIWFLGRRISKNKGTFGKGLFQEGTQCLRFGFREMIGSRIKGHGRGACDLQLGRELLQKLQGTWCVRCLFWEGICFNNPSDLLYPTGVFWALVILLASLALCPSRSHLEWCGKAECRLKVSPK